MDSLYLESVDSTNKWAKEHIKNLNNMTLVYTFNQFAGRGRLNRNWCNTGSDNIYASIVLKPSDKMKNVYSNLTQYLCVVLAQTFEEYGVNPKIKWPNDIQINGKKISGILAEGVNNGKTIEGLVLGFGVNLNTTEEILKKIDQPATSLNLETEKDVDATVFLKKVSDRFCLMYNEFIEKGFSLIKKDYIERTSFIGKNISVNVFDNIVTGYAAEITDNGALKIVDKNNREQILLTGDIL